MLRTTCPYVGHAEICTSALHGDIRTRLNEERARNVPCSGRDQRKLLVVLAVAAPQGNGGAVPHGNAGHAPALAARSADVVVVEVTCRARAKSNTLIHQAFKPACKE